ncbi:hypothetical protein K457DRAFT_699154 [Linnemannia elongata AG-77]|uniref:Uncharacterized protein n=1 Tax=Linnemannia elongata AG-77 TaxID=1314771 RepID=A0A197JMW2_9FUNG|nr:hypothetical protein K457DRAFT_699154 [Linnemannia elongata AG-77]
MSTPNPASPSRQPQNGPPPPRKHNKKKSRSSWKAGFKSTPSSPLQSNLDGRSTGSTAPLTELSYGTNTNTNVNTNISGSTASTNNYSTLEMAPLTTSTPSNDINSNNNNSQSRTSRNPQSTSDNPEGRENRSLPQSQLPTNLKVDTSIKESKTSNNITTTATTTTATTAIAGKGSSTPRKNEFLQNLDIQLIKLQREEERGNTKCHKVRELYQGL